MSIYFDKSGDRKKFSHVDSNKRSAKKYVPIQQDLYTDKFDNDTFDNDIILIKDKQKDRKFMDKIEEVTIFSAPGIGDIAWCLEHVIPNLQPNQKVNIRSWQRGGFASKFLLKLKDVISVEEFPGGGDFTNECHALYPHYCTLKEIPSEMKLWGNTHLEEGKRIEEYLPNFKMSHKLPWEFDLELCKQALQVLQPNRPNIVMYTSSIVNSRKYTYGHWSQNRWVEIMKEIIRRIPTANIIWIGASYDSDCYKHMRKFNSKLKGLVDAPSDTIMTVLRNCDAFISFQSGLSVLSVNEEIPTFMLYFESLRNLMNSWPPLNSVNNQQIYYPTTFTDMNNKRGINTIVDWVESHSKNPKSDFKFELS